MDRLNPLDASFIDVEDGDPHTSMAIALIAVFEGPSPSYDEFLAFLAGRIPLVPRYRQKLRQVPFCLGAPVWIDDQHFDLRYHLRQTALPGPGGDEQLSRLIARVMGQRLDRDYPLWEYWLVTGLAEGRWAVITKVHHCMVDGVSGTDMYRVIFDASPEPSAPAVDDFVVSAEPTDLSLAAQALADAFLLPVRESAALREALARPGHIAAQATETVRALVKLITSAHQATESSLIGPIGRQRRYTMARASLSDVKMVKREFGGTVNDVVLAAISGGFRALLLARGEQPKPLMVPAMVPVSVRGKGEESSYGNRVSALTADLPVQMADPVERLAAIRTQLSDLKAAKAATPGETLVSLGRYAPFPVASLAVRLGSRLPQREIATVATNIPGPRQPLYGMGRMLVEIIPYVPISATVRTGVSIFSYCDNLSFGITGDYETTPDLEVLATGIENGVADLVAAARRQELVRRNGHQPA
jgi:WS/DGAT/MGAT family acyltransferase